MNEDQKRAQKRVVKSHPKASKKILKQVKKAMETTVNEVKTDLDPAATEVTVVDQKAEAALEITVPAGTVNYELMPGVVTVDEAQLNELMDQNVTMKAEIGLLVGLFQNFEGLIKGKAGVMGLMGAIPKLMGNPQITAQIDAVAPIIEKYTAVKS
jgi:hypothetical protein